jgi:hypothetical protein
MPPVLVAKAGQSYSGPGEPEREDRHYDGQQQATEQAKAQPSPSTVVRVLRWVWINALQPSHGRDQFRRGRRARRLGIGAEWR